jgi:ATP-dependent Lon protease
VVESQLEGPLDEVAPATPEVASSAPQDALIIVPVRNAVLFPGTVLSVTIEQSLSVRAAQQAMREQRQIGVLMQKSGEADEPLATGLRGIGTIANIARYVTTPDGAHHLVTQGVQRFEIIEFLEGRPFLVARVRPIVESGLAQGTTEIEARFIFLKGQALEALQLLPQAPPEMIVAIQSEESPSQLADMVASYMDATSEEKQEILETVEIGLRLDLVASVLEPVVLF